MDLPKSLHKNRDTRKQKEKARLNIYSDTRCVVTTPRTPTSEQVGTNYYEAKTHVQLAFVQWKVERSDVATELSPSKPHLL